MNRGNRRALRSAMRTQAQAWPARLVEVPESEWPPSRADVPLRPISVWRSRSYLALVYEEPDFNAIPVRRLTVNRVTIGSDGHWEQDIPWDDLQRCKHEAGYGDWYGIEVYPRDRDTVNIANMRHLWLLAEPLPLGWFA